MAVLGLGVGLWLVGGLTDRTASQSTQLSWAGPVGWLLIVLAVILFALAVPTVSDTVSSPASTGIIGTPSGGPLLTSDGGQVRGRRVPVRFPARGTEETTA